MTIVSGKAQNISLPKIINGDKTPTTAIVTMSNQLVPHIIVDALNSISTHAYVHRLLTILQMHQRIDKSSAGTEFFKASSAVKDNLEEMLSKFIKNLG